jgi:uncharacterized protein (TIGR02444 family)
MRLWDFAGAAWERPGVSEACLALQDRHGQCVGLLLWRAWAAAEGRSIGVATSRRAIAVARVWEVEIVAPLRAARRGLAGDLEGAEPAAAERLRKAVRTLELDAERTLLDTLEALTPPSTGVRSSGLGQPLSTLLEAWNGSRAESLALSLAAALRG